MNRLKELRTDQKKTQKDIAEFLNMSRRGYQKIENGESQIKTGKAQALADYFEVTVAYLLGYSDFKENGNLKDLLFHEIKALKEYRVLRVGYENYISENDVLNVIARYVN
ncbi:helix-turn-helix domain-containing protein [Streptococcus dysgalactiae]|uniref:helix-turn-helix domain-containing protein n=1 Tax=Streptococcus dysgalactiae TaxID=1334 RepID=UPI0022B69805|nr:helix-turn-helix transcriptional regulator [Streptococcus dysgalactiae]